MPDRSQEDAQFHEGTDDAQRSEMTDDALEWRRVTFDLSNEVAFEKIVADRWDSEAGKPAELEDTLWSAHRQRVETIEREFEKNPIPLQHQPKISQQRVITKTRIFWSLHFNFHSSLLRNIRKRLPNPTQASV